MAPLGCSWVLLSALLRVQLLLLCGGCHETEAKVVGAAVLPHGGIALDPAHFVTDNDTAKQEAYLLNKACHEVGKWVGSLEPDILILSTPHGIADLNDFAFYLNSKGFGWADTDNCACPPCCYNVSITMDTYSSTVLAQGLPAIGMNVTGLIGFGGATPFPLAWGEVIPLYFITPHLPANTKVVVISQPDRRYTDSVKMIPELSLLGAFLLEYFDDQWGPRVAVVISGDMAHTHLSTGPYGYSNASQPFDDAVGGWAATLNSTLLLETAASYVDKALSCGYTGLVMLYGMLFEIGAQYWSPHLLANYHPSYYGMMVATFTRKT